MICQWSICTACICHPTPTVSTGLSWRYRQLLSRPPSLCMGQTSSKTSRLCRNFTYLTYWGFTATNLYFFIAMLQNIVGRVYGDVAHSWKFTHFIFPDVMCIELMISSVFWLVFFPYMMQNNRQLKEIDIAQAIGAHLIPLLMLLAELANNTVCFWNFKRAATTMIAMGGYLIVNIAYTLGKETNSLRG